MIYNPSYRHRNVARQVNSDPFAAPTASGITNGLVTAGTATGTALAFDTSAGDSPAGPVTALPSFAVPGSSTASPTPTSAASDSASADSSSNEIPMGTVIGACVGAFVGAVLLVLLGLWLYRRADAKHRKRSPSHSARRKSEQWNRLGDDEDKWDGMHKTREVSNGATVVASDATAEPMEKLTMFKKSSPSIRTAYTHQTHTDETPVTFNLDHPFAQYHPNLAKELASADDPPVKPFVNRIETVSQDASLSGSFLSLRSNRLSGTMSPTLDMAIPTPPLTSSDSHRWESAEVINFEGQSAEIIDPSKNNSNNPFLHHTEIRRKSEHNPFFGAQSDARRPSISKGKGRDITPPTTPPSEGSNPFGDDTETKTHTAVNSVSSSGSNDRAIQSLLAALEVKPQDIQERLRIASMHPSIVSATSVYTEEDVTEAFPLPPGSHGRSS